MSSWNDIPYVESTPPEEKAAQFDAQYAENHAAAEVKNEQIPWFPVTPPEQNHGRRSGDK